MLSVVGLFPHANHAAIHSTVADCGILLPATKARYALNGIEGTYHTSNGMVRIDYVGLMGTCTPVEGSATTWPTFDMMTDNDDHRPTALKVLMPAKAVCALEKRRVPCYDRSNTADVNKAAHYGMLLGGGIGCGRQRAQ